LHAQQRVWQLQIYLKSALRRQGMKQVWLGELPVAPRRACKLKTNFIFISFINYSLQTKGKIYFLVNGQLKVINPSDKY